MAHKKSLDKDLKKFEGEFFFLLRETRAVHDSQGIEKRKMGFSLLFVAAERINFLRNVHILWFRICITVGFTYTQNSLNKLLFGTAPGERKKKDGTSLMFNC